MEIPAWVYFSIWSVIGFTFLHLGFNALDTSGLSLSVHPLVMFFFKHSLAISVCYASTYALIFHQHVKLSIEERYSWLLFGSLPCFLYQKHISTMFIWGTTVSIIIPYIYLEMMMFLPWLTAFWKKYAGVLVFAFVSTDVFAWFPPFFTLINFVFIYDQQTEHRICSVIHMALETSLCFVSGENTEFYPILVLFASFLTSSYWAELSGLDPYTRVSRNLLLTDKESMKLLTDALLLDDRILIKSVQRLLAYESYQKLLADEEVLADERIQRLAADERFYHLIPEAPPPDESHQELLRMAAKLKENFVAFRDRASGKWIEFAIGMVGTILFQSFFKLTSFDHVVSFLYVVVAWVASIALVGSGGSSGDLGVFNFLLGNVIVGCTVSQFGLQATTWFTYGISVSLFGLRLKLESFRFVDREGEQTKVVLW